MAGNKAGDKKPEEKKKVTDSKSDSPEKGVTVVEERKHDTTAPGGRYAEILPTGEVVMVNARGHSFTEDPEKNLAPTRAEMEAEEPEA